MSRYWPKSLFVLSANFREKGASPTNDCWRQKNRVPELSSDVVCVVPFWYNTGVWETNTQTNRETDTRRRLIPALGSVARVKTTRLNVSAHVTCGRGSILLWHQCAIRYVPLLPVLWMTSCCHLMQWMGDNQGRRVCFVQFARWLHRGRSLPSPTASCYVITSLPVG